MAKEYQKTTGASQGLEESVQQMREKVLESEEAVEDKESTLKEIKLRLQHSKIASVPSNKWTWNRYCIEVDRPLPDRYSQMMMTMMSNL